MFGLGFEDVAWSFKKFGVTKPEMILEPLIGKYLHGRKALTLSYSAKNESGHATYWSTNEVIYFSAQPFNSNLY